MANLHTTISSMTWDICAVEQLLLPSACGYVAIQVFRTELWYLATARIRCLHFGH